MNKEFLEKYVKELEEVYNRIIEITEGKEISAFIIKIIQIHLNGAPSIETRLMCLNSIIICLNVTKKNMFECD